MVKTSGGIHSRYRGCLVGLAVGDALGTTLEFREPGTFQPINDMCGGGPFDLAPGQWTDDTSMALCLSASLIESNGFGAHDQMRRYVRWRDEGYMSSTGACFDIGYATDVALTRYVRTGDPYAGSTAADTAGNGSLMRLAPVPMFFAGDAAGAIEMSAQSSRVTHGATEAVDACRYFSGLLVGALNGVDKDSLLASAYSPVENHWVDAPLTKNVAEVAHGSFKQNNPPESFFRDTSYLSEETRRSLRNQTDGVTSLIKGSGYVVKSLEAALWAFHKSNDFRDGALLAVNLGDDADTTGAIYGQLAGAYYGYEGIPVNWRQRLAMACEICELADRIRHAARQPQTGEAP